MTNTCACGNPSGSNPECERCRLIARVAELEADLLDHKQLIADKREAVKDLTGRVAELEQEVERLRSVLSKWESFPAYFTGAGELREETRKVLYQ